MKESMKSFVSFKESEKAIDEGISFKYALEKNTAEAFDDFFQALSQ